MDLEIASLLVRQHMALIDEGIGPKNPKTGDAQLLAAAVRAGGADEFSTDYLRDYRLVDEDGTLLGDYPPCPALSYTDQIPCAHRAGHSRVFGPTGPRELYDHSAPDHRVYWND